VSGHVEWLLELYHRNGGRLTPDIVVDDAEPENSPYHQDFEWDDAVCGKRYRIGQARDIIRACRVRVVEPVADGNLPVTRMFISINTHISGAHDDDDDDDELTAPMEERTRSVGYVYQPLDVVVADSSLTERVRADYERQWKELFAKLQLFDEVLKVVRRDIEDLGDR